MSRVITGFLILLFLGFGVIIWLIGPGHDYLGRNNTLYSPSYNESKFDSVALGMRRIQNEVINILGPPLILSIHKQGYHAKHQAFKTEFTDDTIVQEGIVKIVYCYSKPKKMADYELTHIAFDKTLKVSGKAKWVTD